VPPQILAINHPLRYETITDPTNTVIRSAANNRRAATTRSEHSVLPNRLRFAT
jgi:hypothetical protein